MNNQSVNKDILIQALTRQNNHLNQLVHVLQAQLNNYRENIEIYKALIQKGETPESDQTDLLSKSN